jgi:hypothetical protein
MNDFDFATQLKIDGTRVERRELLHRLSLSLTQSPQGASMWLLAST